MLYKKILLSLSLISALATFAAHAGFDDDFRPVHYHSAIPKIYTGALGKIAFALTIETINKDNDRYILANIAQVIQHHCKNSLISIKEVLQTRTIEFVIQTNLMYESSMMDNLVEICLTRVSTIHLKTVYFQTATEKIMLNANSTISKINNTVEIR